MCPADVSSWNQLTAPENDRQLWASMSKRSEWEDGMINKACRRVVFLSELLREPHKVSFHRCYMFVWISVCTAWIWKRKNPEAGWSIACQFWLVLNINISSHAPHPFHLHPDSSEVPCSNTPHPVCTAWSWRVMVLGVLGSGVWGAAVATDLPGSDGEEQGRARHHADGAGISDSDCWRALNSLVWEQISPVSGVSLCLCFTFSRSSQRRNEHRWLREEEWARESMWLCVCMCLCERLLIAWI